MQCNCVGVRGFTFVYYVCVLKYTYMYVNVFQRRYATDIQWALGSVGVPLHVTSDSSATIWAVFCAALGPSVVLQQAPRVRQLLALGVARR